MAGTATDAARALVKRRRVEPGQCKRPGCGQTWIGRPEKIWCSKKCAMWGSRRRASALRAL